MPSKRTMRKEKPAEITKRLKRLLKIIQKDEAEFAKVRDRWYNEYLHTGAIEFLRKNNISVVCREHDLKFEPFPYYSLQRVINVIAEQVVRKDNKND